MESPNCTESTRALDESHTSKPIVSPLENISIISPGQNMGKNSQHALSLDTSVMSVDTSGEISIMSQESTISSSAASPRSRILLPSPSRPRIDPQYVTRLAPRQSPTSVNSGRASRGGASAVLLPPSINRKSANSTLFRPPSVVTPAKRTPTDAAAQQQQQQATTESLLGSPQRTEKSSTSSLSPCISSSSYYSTGMLSSNSAATPRRYSTRYLNDVGQGDRFIPSRATSNFNFSLWDDRRLHGRGSDKADDGESQASNTNNSDVSNNTHNSGTGDSATNRNNDNSGSGTYPALLDALLRSELLGENADSAIAGFPANGSQHQQEQYGRSHRVTVPLRDSVNYFRFQSPRQAYQSSVYDESTSVVDSFSLVPVGSAARQRLLSTPQKRKRRIQKVPFKVLDAPALQDDFYLNLVDWSSQNVLAVGLGSCVYLWSACTSKVTKLCDLYQSEDVITSVSWSQRGTHLAVGTNRGEVQLWDTVRCEKIRTMGGHSARIGTLSWTGPTLASGSRDRQIFLRDVRVEPQYTHRLSAHKQEVCGLKWSFDEPSMLASGGNDNKLLVWDIKNHSQPVHRFAEHTAAVKAIAWSPHQHGLLSSGGGTADRCIRFWNTLSGLSLNCIDTGSQVCNLAWSHNCNEIVSTHGYSLNQIVVWRYPSMSKVVTLTGHTFRVLYLAISPDGSTIVTGAGDETLRFWQVFPGPRSQDKSNTNGLLFPSLPGSVVR